MKKVFRFEGLECPNCAKKLEAALLTIDGVSAASVNYITGKMMIEGDDARFDAIVEAAVAEGKKVKPAFAIKG